MFTGELEVEKWKPLLREDKPNVVYILRLCNEDFYVGSTTNFYQRMKQHQDRLDMGARATRKNPALEIVRVESFRSYCEARHREMQIKGWSRAKKEALIKGYITDLCLLAHGKEISPECKDTHSVVSLVEDPEQAERSERVEGLGENKITLVTKSKG